jgi:hypothetical protein
MAKADLARTGSNIRCAIYTRKSSDDGLNDDWMSAALPWLCDGGVFAISI